MVMPYVVVDVEATCWSDGRSRRRNEMEIIEIGAVRLDDALEIMDEFGSFVRPVVHRELSEFCISLTSITQADVDEGRPFSEVFAQFCEWIGDEQHWFCSWGSYDLGQFQLDCRRSGLAFPTWIEPAHVNLKEEFAAWRGVRRCGMAKALSDLGLPLEGTHHRGIDDARNIARIASQMLPHLDGVHGPPPPAGPTIAPGALPLQEPDGRLPGD
jgi:inhibitor of KinA sporulation pathway (predicted exonuclease)